MILCILINQVNQEVTMGKKIKKSDFLKITWKKVIFRQKNSSLNSS